MSVQTEVTASTSEAIAQVSQFFHLSPDMQSIWDLNGTFQQLNLAWEKTLGFAIAELKGRSYWEWVHPQDRELTRAKLQNLTETSQTISFVNRLRTAEGSYKWLSWKVSLCDDRYWYAIARDVIASKRAAEAIEQAEAKYRSIYENAVEGIFQTTPQGNYISANPALARIYGYSSVEAMISALTDIEHQLYVDPKRRLDFINQLQTCDTVSNFESEVYRQDGSKIWISESARSVRDRNGNLLYFEGFVEDITERKQVTSDLALAVSAAARSAAELEASLALLRATLESTVNGIMAVDLKGNVVAYNQKLMEMWGFADKATIEHNRTERIQAFIASLKDDRAFVARIDELYANPEREAYDRLELKDGRIFECYSLPQRVGQKIIGRVWSFGDITERQKIERMKNEFVSMVSHELRTPLTSIRGSLSLIVGGVTGEIPPQAKTLIEIAYKNSERLVLLINDILDIEKIESGKMDFHLQPVELISLVEQAIEANRAYGEQFGVRFELETQIRNVKVNVDSDRFIQVMTNLLSNAAKFSPLNDTVVVSVTGDRHSVRVSVTDRGSGIPEAFRAQIFQKFAQADSSDSRQKGGTGLGLSISKAIIEKLGGQIGFKTATHAGTTFYFDLPQWLSPPPITAVRESHKPRILICEDDRDIAHLLSLMLSSSGFCPDIAYSATEAKQLLTQDESACPYVAMTLDLALPDRDGLSLMRELRECDRLRDFPIVIVSASAQSGRQELRGSAFAAIDWLDKPIDRERLIAAVRQAAWRKADSKPKILHVEDDPDILQVVSVILRDVAEITCAHNLQVAQQCLATESFDLVILDLELPDGYGLELLPKLRRQGTKATVPVVVFSAQDISQEATYKVAATLVKTRTSNQALLDTIESLIQSSELNSETSDPS